MSPVTKRRSIIGAIVTLFASLLLTLMGNTIYTLHAVHASQQQLCGVISISLAPKPVPPANPNALPTSEYGRELQAYTKAQAAVTDRGKREMQRLSSKYNCPEGK